MEPLGPEPKIDLTDSEILIHYEEVLDKKIIALNEALENEARAKSELVLLTSLVTKLKNDVDLIKQKIMGQKKRMDSLPKY